MAVIVLQILLLGAAFLVPWRIQPLVVTPIFLATVISIAMEVMF